MSSQIPSLSQSMLALYGPELKLQSASYAVCIHQIMVGNYLEELLHWQYASIKHMWLAKNIYIHTHTLGSWMLKLINYLLRKKSPWIFICYTKPIVLIHTWPTDPNRYIIVSPVPSAVGDDQYESKATPLTCQPHKELNKLVMIIHNESIKTHHYSMRILPMSCDPHPTLRPSDLPCSKLELNHLHLQSRCICHPCW